MPMRTETTIEGYAVVLDTGGKSPQCFIAKGKFEASLDALSATGKLFHRSNDAEHVVPGAILGDIENWAYNNGY